MPHPVLDVRPFEAIPRDLIRRIRPFVAAAADDPLDSAARATLLAALRRFYDLVEDPGSAWPEIARAYRAEGRDLAVRGADPEETHRALRRAAQTVWRTLIALADTLDVDRVTLGRIAEAQFGYMDAVAAEIAAGYEEESAHGAEGLRRRRARLSSVLLGGGDAAAIADAAADAGWTLPRTLAAVVLHPRRDRGVHPPTLPPDVLVDLVRREPCLLLPDPDGPGRGRVLEALLGDWIVVAGPTLPPDQAPESLRWARQGLELARRGRLPASDVVRCMDHVPTLVIFGAETLIHHAADARLAPLHHLSEAQAERLSETLLSLLECNFNATEASARLHVHPQTVRYRLRHLEELFGESLRDPDHSLELEMILHARHAPTPTR
ncbi:helix-turn-helix domain-containing protein [Actinomadura flavalba]|uniref:helix-turn-helix domain-containing protein n=1 Tax=Actinomadura flavalba TaxID=1120938 RepID=UPI0003602F81|nr:helix-turn-helix domain-containing protein [Actinomadura flavalba]